MIPLEDRRQIVIAVDEERTAGARLEAACMLADEGTYIASHCRRSRGGTPYAESLFHTVKYRPASLT